MWNMTKKICAEISSLPMKGLNDLNTDGLGGF